MISNQNKKQTLETTIVRKATPQAGYSKIVGRWLIALSKFNGNTDAVCINDKRACPCEIQLNVLLCNCDPQGHRFQLLQHSMGPWHRKHGHYCIHAFRKTLDFRKTDWNAKPIEARMHSQNSPSPRPYLTKSTLQKTLLSEYLIDSQLCICRTFFTIKQQMIFRSKFTKSKLIIK